MTGIIEGEFKERGQEGGMPKVKHTPPSPTLLPLNINNLTLQPHPLLHPISPQAPRNPASISTICAQTNLHTHTCSTITKSSKLRANLWPHPLPPLAIHLSMCLNLTCANLTPFLQAHTNTHTNNTCTQKQHKQHMHTHTYIQDAATRAWLWGQAFQ